MLQFDRPICLESFNTFLLSDFLIDHLQLTYIDL